jgi:hypothetical protein
MAFNNATNFSIGSVRVDVAAGSDGRWSKCGVSHAALFQYSSNAIYPGPLQLLLESSSLDATTDSVGASYAPKCHPETREAVTNDIMDWAQDPLEPKPVLWISGPAGAGKTCIQRKIVDLLKGKGLFAGAFIFSTKSLETNNESRLISTLALQLGQTTPNSKPFILKAIEDDPGIFKKSLEVQAESLIFGPLQRLHSSSTSSLPKRLLGSIGWVSPTPMRPNFIVIDGLDECAEGKEQTHIVGLFHKLATHPSYPFRIIVASRPEYEIRRSFASPPLVSITRSLKLETYEADSDIRRFLIHELARLRSTHPCASIIPLIWPLPRDIQILVEKASRQFIFVATVIKYLDHPRRNPMVELKNILDLPSQPSSTGGNTFAELGALYTKVLHPPGVDIPLLRTILHTIIHHNHGSPLNELSEIDNVLHLDPGTTDIALSDLHSIVSLGSPVSPRISFHHRSIEDFLMSSTRAGDLYQDAATIVLRLVEARCRLSKLEITGSRKANDQLGLAVIHLQRLPEQQMFEMGDFLLETLPRYMEEAFLATISGPQMARSGAQLFLLTPCNHAFVKMYHRYAVRLRGLSDKLFH